MNLKWLSLILLPFLSTTIATHSQQDPFADDGPDNSSPRMIRVLAEFIEMPQSTYIQLVAQPRTGANNADLRAKCAKLIEDEKARIAETFSVVTLPGQGSTIESIREVIYPTEPELFNSLPGGQQPALARIPKILGTPPTPSAFDTRNVGSTFEVEAQIDPSKKIVEMRLTPNIVYHADTKVWSTWQAGEAKVEKTTLLFYVLTTKTGLTVVDGQTHLASTLSPQNEQGFTDSSRKVMFFVRADIITVEL